MKAVLSPFNQINAQSGIGDWQETEIWFAYAVCAQPETQAIPLANSTRSYLLNWFWIEDSIAGVTNGDRQHPQFIPESNPGNL